ncbi:MAG: hypothetical protein D6743_14165 [Calditrichaeota bacterium]|nr:MAG: hypothetical protein D6743_14165 [Calditrichota bacterium]
MTAHKRRPPVWDALAPIFLFVVFLTLLAAFPIFAQDSDWEARLSSRSRRMGEFYFVSLHDVAEVLGAHTYYSNKVRKAILYLPERKITVTAFNPFVRVGQKVFQMPVDATYKDGDIYLPFKFFLPLLKQGLQADESVTDGADADDLRSTANIDGVRIEEKTNGTLIRVKIRPDLREPRVSTRYSRRWLYVDILGGRIDQRHFGIENASKLVSKVVPVQMEQMVQLSFYLKRDVSGKRFDSYQTGDEVWISIPAKDKVNPEIIARLRNDQAKWRFDTIVIDPGHGGKDPGTIGRHGTYEKDVVLGIGLQLRKILKRKMKDVKVIMTRDSDRYISLKERTRLANKHQGKLFISIHANWNRNSRVHGATTYFLGLAKSEEALEIAQRENAVIKYDDGGEYSDLTEEQIILAAMAQNAYNKESQDFADIIQHELHQQTGIANRGVKQAGFYVLVGASMPNVLIETAFMSNKREEKMLRSSSFQKKVAEAIYRSIKKFKEKYEWSLK